MVAAWMAARSAVHPRACGEREMSGVTGPYATGSSPRLRGTRRRLLWRSLRTRFIPAPAGNAWLYSGDISEESVHPRACGERGHHAPPTK